MMSIVHQVDRRQELQQQQRQQLQQQQRQQLQQQQRQQLVGLYSKKSLRMNFLKFFIKIFSKHAHLHKI